MEVGDKTTKIDHHLRSHSALLDEPRQPLFFREALHHHRDLFHRGGRVEAEPAVLIAVDGRQIDINGRGDPAVELELGHRGGAALLQRGEIEEAHVHRLLDLVDVVAGEEQVRDMGLAVLDPLHRGIVALGISKEVDDVFRRCALAHLGPSSHSMSKLSSRCSVRSRMSAGPSNAPVGRPSCR